MADQREAVSTPILSGWKEIAKHLGRGVRTLQRYERELGLPIRRPAGGARGSVIATAAELDAWVYTKPLRAAFTLRRDLPQQNTALADLRKVLAEHRRLREEMSIFRADLHTCMKAFREQCKSLEASRTQELLPSPRPISSVEIQKRRPN